jgi:hypothetical protein
MHHRIDPKTAALPEARRCAARDAVARSRGAFARANGHRHDARVAREHRGYPGHAGGELHRGEGGRS